MRIAFGGLLFTHGFAKVSNYEALAAGGFPDVTGLGSQVSVLLAIFAEAVCSLAFIFGMLTRLCLLPMIATMAVAFFCIHGGSISEGELAFAYLIVFVSIWIAGPGRYSVDALLRRLLIGRK